MVKISCVAIGDGGNDVNMIQQADIGVGIFGKEGNQAANAADYAFGKFKFLRKLLLFHGRFISMNYSYFVYYFFFKNFLITWPQIFFSFQNLFSGLTFWESFYLSNFNTLTGFPIGGRTLVQEDIALNKDNNKIFAPFLYRRSRDQGDYFSYLKFTFWSLYGFFAGAVIYFFSINIFSPLSADNQDGRDYSMWGRSLSGFTANLLLLLIILIADSRHWHWLYWTCIIFTYVIAFPAFALIYDHIPSTDVYSQIQNFFLSWKFHLAVIALVSIAYFPYLIAQQLLRLCKPRHIDLLYEMKIDKRKQYHQKINAYKCSILSQNISRKEIKSPPPPPVKELKVEEEKFSNRRSTSRGKQYSALRTKQKEQDNGQSRNGGVQKFNSQTLEQYFKQQNFQTPRSQQMFSQEGQTGEV